MRSNLNPHQAGAARAAFADAGAEPETPAGGAAVTAAQPQPDREALIAEAEARADAAAQRTAAIDAQLARAAQADPESTRVLELRRAGDLALEAHTHEAYSVFLLAAGRDADAAECRAAAAEAWQAASSWADPAPETEAAGHVDPAAAARWHQAQTELVGLIREDNRVLDRGPEAGRLLPDSLGDWMESRVTELEQAEANETEIEPII